jgi:hypothetical protein
VEEEIAIFQNRAITKKGFLLGDSVRNSNVHPVLQIFLILFSAKNWEIMLLNYFYGYAILLHLNFSVLTVDWGRAH